DSGRIVLPREQNGEVVPCVLPLFRSICRTHPGLNRLLRRLHPNHEIRRGRRELRHCPRIVQIRAGTGGLPSKDALVCARGGCCVTGFEPMLRDREGVIGYKQSNGECRKNEADDDAECGEGSASALQWT